MSYRSILANIDIDFPTDAIVAYALDLAKAFDARLVGFASADVPMPIVTTEGMVVDGGFLEDQREEIDERIAAAKVEFERIVGSAAASNWHSIMNNPTRALTDAARLADLIVTASPPATGDNANRDIDIASVTLHSGRPLLVAATGGAHPLGGKAMVAWKDTREARRAVRDAAPLLAKASEVAIVTVDRDELDTTSESLEDVARYLADYGIAARTEILNGHDDSYALLDYAQAMSADLVVFGAFGHSRLREWVFGGVTHSLLAETGFNRFVSS